MTLGHRGRIGLSFIFLVFILLGASLRAAAAPYAALVMDARSGKVLHARNADTQLHPASLTKMMTLYVAFEAIARGEVTLDTKFLISKKAAAEPPSKLGLKAGQRIELRYLIRAAAIKSANDAATAIAEGISGSEAAFARRMNRTAKALGMSRTKFKNAHGLTESGHLSTARDMTQLGRKLFYHYPEYYNLFSRRSTDAKVRHVNNTNSRLLSAYKGADGIKTGYTRAAGFNLVASAERGNERIIATVFGGRSTASRNAKVAELLDLGFKRAPSRVALRKPALPKYNGPPPKAVVTADVGAPSAKTPARIKKGKTIRLQLAVKTSPRPMPRPLPKPVVTPPEALLAAMQSEIDAVVAEAATAPVPEPALAPEVKLADAKTIKPKPRAPELVATASTPQAPAKASLLAAIASAPVAKPMAKPERMLYAGGPVVTPRAKPRPVRQLLTAAKSVVAPEPAPQRVVTRVSSSGGKGWGISVGLHETRYKAEKTLLKTALSEMGTLKGTLRKVVNRPSGWDAAFLGMSRDQAELACQKLAARGKRCKTLSPG